MKNIAENCGVEFLYRDPAMCTSKPRWDEVVVAILSCYIKTKKLIKLKENVKLQKRKYNGHDSCQNGQYKTCHEKSCFAEW